ncbi:cadherin-4-like [Mercenaria mercenaria]|uniref:cadherin-4-like n=1 Tax=Mercenaria mercenaria TaxID=6596 RepID=UPI00234EFC38|nr:cadherin-4-like [Mercenaria mercenaria]
MAEIIIYITDVNDNRPIFTERIYEVYMDEDEGVGYSVAKIEANDIDSLDFGTQGIRYRLVGAYSDLFDIKEDTGEVTVAACATYGSKPCLDYDYPPTLYTLSVQAIDNRGDIGSKDSTVTLNVHLRDVNDNPPEVPDYRREIKEGQRYFTPDLIVQGTDRDNSQLVYSIESQGPGQFWAINSTTGVIYTKSPDGIDYRDGAGSDIFEVKVKVSEVGGKYWTFSDVVIRVKVSIHYLLLTV